MKHRKPLLKSLLAKLVKTKASPTPAPRRVSERKVRSSIEGLEGRIAPAAVFVNTKTVSYTDFDGDFVTVTFSKPVFLNKLTTQRDVDIAAVFKSVEVTPGHDQLQLIDLTHFPTGVTASGVSFTLAATQAGGGNGHADVGAVNAPGIALGAVNIDGDLGKITAGNFAIKTALVSLTAESIGKRGIATQLTPATGTANLVSTLSGALGTLKVVTDVEGARLSVVNGTNFFGQTTSLGKITSIAIGGSLKSGASTGDFAGSIDTASTIGTVKIGGIEGGGGEFSGRILAGGAMTSVTVAGSVTGGAGQGSGSVVSQSTLGLVKIGGDLVGNVGSNSGRVEASGNLPSATVGGDLRAGAGAGSGVIASGAALGTVLVTGKIDGSTGSTGTSAGGILGGTIAKVTAGSLLGGAGVQNGFIDAAGNLGAVKILGEVTGGGGQSSASIVAHGKLTSVTVGGSVAGGVGQASGSIASGTDPLRAGDLGSVIVIGRLKGGAGDNSGAISSGSTIGAVTIGSLATSLTDAVLGDAGRYSGSISATGGIKTVKIVGNVTGGGGDTSGAILSTDRGGNLWGDLGVVTVTGKLAGGAGDHSGSIRAERNLTAATLGALQGGTGVDSGSLHTGLSLQHGGNATTIQVLGTISKTSTGTPGANSTSVVIDGNLTSFIGKDHVSDGSVHVAHALGSLSLAKDVTNFTVTARGQAVQTKTDVAIGKIDVKGNVTGSSFLAGYDLAGVAVNPDAQIGTVTVAALKNWTASNLVAGVSAGADLGFGTSDDVKATGFDNPLIVSKIASILIGGTVSGTSASTTDHFGFVAQIVAKFKSTGQTPILNNVADTQLFELNLPPLDNDVSIREVAVS